MGLLTFLTNIFSSCSDGKSTFKPGLLAPSGYYVHNDKVYYYGGFNNASIKELPGADAKSFTVLNEISPDREFASLFARDDTQVYYSGEVLENVDPQTFEVLGSELGKDKDRVFSRTSVLSEDPENFVALKDGFYKDSKAVFRNDRIVSNDPMHFNFLKTEDGITYCSDSKGIIANNIRIDSADVSTFKALRYGYSVDKKHVYLIEDATLRMLTGIDPSTFRVLSLYYSADANRVFWRGKELPKTDPSTFKIINEEVHCTHDAERAYHWNNIIPDVDPATFPKDKPCKYCTDRKVVF